MIKEINMEYSWKYDADKDSPYNWMINDLSRGIQTNSNYLVALGIFAYSEAIGWNIIGDKDGWKCYDKFTKDYVRYDFISEPIFKDIRNGLAHRYFMKNRVGRVFNDKGDLPHGIIITPEVTIYINSYFRDFVKGVEQYVSS